MGIKGHRSKFKVTEPAARILKYHTQSSFLSVSYMFKVTEPAACILKYPSGEIARHSTFEISGKKMTTSTNLVSVHTNLLCVCDSVCHL